MTCFGQQSSSAGWGSNGGAQRVEATSILYKAYSTSTVRPRSSGKAYIIDPPTLSGDQSKSFAPFFPSRLLHITSIPDEYAGRYELLLPIPVTYDEVEPGAVIASFQVAEINITGNSRQDARDSLTHWILELFGDLLREDPETLGPIPTNQIQVIQQHIRQR